MAFLRAFTLFSLFFFYPSCSPSKKKKFLDIDIVIPNKQALFNERSVSTRAVTTIGLSDIDCVGVLVGYPGEALTNSGNKGTCTKNNNDVFYVAAKGGTSFFTNTSGQNSVGATVTVSDVKVGAILNIVLIGFNSNGVGCVDFDSGSFDPVSLGYSEAYILDELSGASITSGQTNSINLTAEFDSEIYIAECESPVIDAEFKSSDETSEDSLTEFPLDDTSELAFWLDATDVDTLYTDSAMTTTVGDGDLIAVWEDKSGNGNHAVQTSGPSMPVWGSNSYSTSDGINFDGVADHLTIPDDVSIDDTTHYSFAVVIANLGSNHNSSCCQQIFNKNNSIGGDRTAELYSGGSGAIYFARDDSGAFTDIMNSGAMLTDMVPQVIIGVVSTAQTKLYIDGAITGSDSTANGVLNTDNPLYLGTSDGSNSFWNGAIYEFIWFARELSVTEIGELNAYLLNKYPSFL